MAETQAATGLVPAHWTNRYFTEYLRENRFARYMGTSEGAMIQVREDLTTKHGDRIYFATVRRLKRDGVTDDTVLEGNEEELDSRSMSLVVGAIRHAFIVTKWQGQKSVIALADAGRAELKRWSTTKLKNDLVTALFGIDGVAYAAATASQRNTWMVNNADRVLFGSQIANASSGVMATALATVDNTSDKLSPGLISLAKRRAMLADPPIRPIQVKGADGEQEWFVMWVHPLAMRDLQNDTAMMQANRDALERGKGNPLFTGGDLLWDGVIIKELREAPILAGAGTGGINVAANFLCGAQALGVAWAMRPEVVVEERDYKWRHGVATQEMRGLGKLRFGTGAEDTDTPKDAGVVTVFTAAVADT